MPLKILAFNASPRKETGTTDTLMDLLLSSMSDSGADVEKHYVVDLDIKGCLGCFSCWWKTPGRCVHRDDMDWVLPKMVEADIIVLGTPIYHYNIIHYLQRMRERTLPLNLPDMIVKKDETHHPERHRRKKPQQTVVIAVCGFPDLGNFNQVRGLFPEAVKIFLPASWALYVEALRPHLKDFLSAVEEAGLELVENGSIELETRKRLIVEYPDELKERIRTWYNVHSARM
jgi:hypothetical protein